MYMPLSMIAEEETEVELVLFRLPEMTDEGFERMLDLASLKRVLQESA